MTVLCAYTKTSDLCACSVAQRKLPVENQISSGHFDSTSNKVKVMARKFSKGLKFPALILPGLGHALAVAQVFYVATTRATQRVVIDAYGGSELGKTSTH